MTDSFRMSQPSSRISPESLTAPLLYLSSAEAGWEGLVALAFHEPTALEGWTTAPASDISLILFAGGAMHMEQRHAQRPWQGVTLGHDDLILRPGASLSYEVRWQCLSPTPTQTLHLHLSRTLFSRTAEEVADCDPSRLSLSGRVGFQDTLLAQIGLALWRELAAPSSVGKLYAQTAAQMLSVHLLRHYASTARTIKEPTNRLTQRQVKQVTEFIVAHLTQDLSLETLAQQAGFSAYHFARLFRQTMGESPHQFVLRQRIEKAQRLLKDTNAPLARIALDSGFANQSHFTRIFKHRLGLTPRAYRQEYNTFAHFDQNSQE